jgi:hypothetical protein
MTRLDLLKILIGQARTNGFDFRQWFTTCLRLPWESQRAALDILESQRRYYALLFNHDFAQAFWKAGEPITFQVAAQTFERLMPDGSVRVVTRKPFMRRSGRPDAWRYHLRQMALATEPLRYMRKYLRVEEDLVVPPTNHLKITSKIAAATQLPPSKKPTLSPALTTLELARKAAAERRKRAVADLPPLAAQIPSSTKRGPRLPGSR